MDKTEARRCECVQPPWWIRTQTQGFGLPFQANARVESRGQPQGEGRVSQLGWTPAAWEGGGVSESQLCFAWLAGLFRLLSAFRLVWFSWTLIAQGSPCSPQHTAGRTTPQYPPFLTIRSAHFQELVSAVLHPQARENQALLPALLFFKVSEAPSLSFLEHNLGNVLLVPRPGIEPVPSAVKAQSPNLWTAREFPGNVCFKFSNSDFSPLSKLYH